MFTTINHPYQLKLNNLYLDSEVEVKAVLHVGRPPGSRPPGVCRGSRDYQPLRTYNSTNNLLEWESNLILTKNLPNTNQK